MGESKDEESMSEEDWTVPLCPFCGGTLWHNDGRFIPVNEKEINIYRCCRCKSEFIDNFRLKRKGEKVYLEREGYIWI